MTNPRRRKRSGIVRNDRLTPLARALSTDATEAIALEDSLNSLRAARTSGIFTAVVPHAMTRNLDLSEIDLLPESMEEFDLTSRPFRDS